MKYRLLLILWVLHSYCAFGQLGNTADIPIDSTSTITPKEWTEDLSQKYIGEEFNYQIKTGESQNLLARFITWIGQGLQRVFGIEISPQVLQVVEHIIYLLMALLAIYLLVKVLTNESFNSIFTRKAKNLGTVNLTEEHIETIDLHKLLQDALQVQNYRLAIRYQFLLTLQNLSKKEIISWHFEKTNSDYLSEIKEKNLKQGFKKVSYLYDHIWYGEQEIDIDRYDQYTLEFNSINHLITV
ncbi:hypothetical protein Q2T41_03685 [Maribacter confluentis]|uniref:DUF4129 domain-containing protein n=1 Tax=Maribacter confluentis TaxID=1656093 RepID=A0ABT8RLG4_9FLAO|nr:hypothetical protein [Maribacter confluentis]MDO1511765.1 hypothetical protein [Maribacter confluentis]